MPLNPDTEGFPRNFEKRFRNAWRDGLYVVANLSGGLGFGGKLKQAVPMNEHPMMTHKNPTRFMLQLYHDETEFPSLR